jgi:hypothetical protein
VVSGGYYSPLSSPSAAVVSRKSGRRKWTVTVDNQHGELTVIAYCRRKRGVSTASASVSVSGAGNKQGSTTATCPRGRTLVSGGHETVDPGLAPANDLTAFTSHRLAPRGWETEVVNNHPAASTLNVFAYCQRRGKVKERAASVPISANSNGSATATCHADEEVISGGYATSPATDWFNASGPDLFYGQSYRSARRSWTASAHNYSNVGGTLTALAYCGKQRTVHPPTKR